MTTCRECHRRLTDRVSKAREYGEVCDPDAEARAEVERALRPVRTTTATGRAATGSERRRTARSKAATTTATGQLGLFDDALVDDASYEDTPRLW